MDAGYIYTGLVVALLLGLGFLATREFWLYLKEKKLAKNDENKNSIQEKSPPPIAEVPPHHPNPSHSVNNNEHAWKKRIDQLESENKKLKNELISAKNDLEWQEKKLTQLSILHERPLVGPAQPVTKIELKLNKKLRTLKLRNEELEDELSKYREELSKMESLDDDLKVINKLYSDLKNDNQKLNIQEFIDYMKTYNIERLFHVTERKNLENIRKYGLLSWEFIETMKLFQPAYVSDELSRELDTRYRRQDYIRLSFTENIPMMHQKLKSGEAKDLITLYIDKKVMLWRDTLFSDKNATANDARVGENIEHLKNIRFDIVLGKTPYYELSEEEKSFYQAEVLVKRHIPRRFITNLDKPKDFKSK
jgi:hypothetical protein